MREKGGSWQRIGRREKREKRGGLGVVNGRGEKTKEGKGREEEGKERERRRKGKENEKGNLGS